MPNAEPSADPFSPDPAAGPVGVVSTHISIVFFVGDRAFKLKRPVRYPFIDLRGRAEREQLCHREVELNRRMAPDVYLGVADVMGADGEPCDHLVVMRRLPADRRLSDLVLAGDPVAAEAVDQLAAQLAGLHRRAERSPAIDAAATGGALARRWDELFAELAEAEGDVLDPARVSEARRLSARFLSGRDGLFASRIADGCVCDGHGDLQTDDVFCLDDGPRALDCIEFNDEFRHGDIANDVAFLMMDLDRLGAPDLARRFASAYEAAAGVRLPPALLDFYVAYRALVRCMVAALRALSPGANDVDADGGLARRLLELCTVHLRAAIPRLVLVGGLPGTGKSTVAEALGHETGWPVLRSDVVRKELAGLAPTQPAGGEFGAGLYDASTTDGVYAALVERAARHLALGSSVVVDASFTDRRHRAEARGAADRLGAVPVELRCDVARSEADRRLTERSRRGTDASDATPEVARRMAERADPWPEAATLSTDGSRQETLGAALEVLARSVPA